MAVAGKKSARAHLLLEIDIHAIATTAASVRAAAFSGIAVPLTI
jgi:hypothetical protein